jgi:hypothetical protein
MSQFNILSWVDESRKCGSLLKVKKTDLYDRVDKIRSGRKRFLRCFGACREAGSWIWVPYTVTLTKATVSRNSSSGFKLNGEPDEIFSLADKVPRFKRFRIYGWHDGSDVEFKTDCPNLDQVIATVRILGKRVRAGLDEGELKIS